MKDEWGYQQEFLTSKSLRYVYYLCKVLDKQNLIGIGIRMS